MHSFPICDEAMEKLRASNADLSFFNIEVSIQEIRVKEQAGRQV